ncbi:MAG: hypothetical protein DI551_08260 [Micavibrio aeruginosavorus]|uniref:Uncharacterized protein n=1 Tax=Micavibrio aeruginosavorus TaxID=349221 RepID=A0A2W5MV57_9BACT|nr:MAG: hypothetical protein DI551_08260 [Micavibrio aeruginosavorus]
MPRAIAIRFHLGETDDVADGTEDFIVRPDNMAFPCHNVVFRVLRVVYLNERVPFVLKRKESFDAR